MSYFKEYMKVVAKSVAIFTILGIYGYINSHFINFIIKSSIIGKEPFLVSLSVFKTIVLMIIPALILILIFIYFKLKKYANGAKLISVYNGINYFEHSKSKKSKRIYNITFLILIIINILLFAYLINDYTLAYNNKIEKHNLINSKNLSYNYSDIIEVSIGAKRRRAGGDLFYIVKFKDNNNIDLAVTTISEKSTIDSLLELNDIIKKNNIERKVDKKNFHNLVQNLGEKYVKDYEELFR